MPEEPKTSVVKSKIVLEGVEEYRESLRLVKEDIRELASRWRLSILWFISVTFSYRSLIISSIYIPLSFPPAGVG